MIPDRSLSLDVATWNVEWATPGTRRGDRVAAVLLDLADVMVVTECTLGVLPPGHVVAGGDDWGYRVDDPTRRKVALWSRWPWRDVDPVGHPDLPPGRFKPPRVRRGRVGSVLFADVHSDGLTGHSNEHWTARPAEATDSGSTVDQAIDVAPAEIAPVREN